MDGSNFELSSKSKPSLQPKISHTFVEGMKGKGEPAEVAACCAMEVGKYQVL